MLFNVQVGWYWFFKACQKFQIVAVAIAIKLTDAAA